MDRYHLLFLSLIPHPVFPVLPFSFFLFPSLAPLLSPKPSLLHLIATWLFLIDTASSLAKALCKREKVGVDLCGEDVKR